MSNKKKLKPFNAVIQQCPYCGKLDVYLGDGHFCSRAEQIRRIENEEYYD
jgi:hypothetical protein